MDKYSINYTGEEITEFLTSLKTVLANNLYIIKCTLDSLNDAQAIFSLYFSKPITLIGAGADGVGFPRIILRKLPNSGASGSVFTPIVHYVDNAFTKGNYRYSSHITLTFSGDNISTIINESNSFGLLFNTYNQSDNIPFNQIIQDTEENTLKPNIINDSRQEYWIASENFTSTVFRGEYYPHIQRL